MSETTQKPKRKRKVTKFFIVITSIVSVLVLTTLILGFVTVRPVRQFSDFSSVGVIHEFDGRLYPVEDGDAVEDALSTVRFSVLRAMLEGSLNYRIRPETRFNPDTQEDERVSLGHRRWGEIRPAQNEYMLLFRFDTPQTNRRFFHYRMDADGVYRRHNIIFDRLILIVPSPDLGIQRVTLFPYLEHNIDNQIDGAFGPGFNTPDENGHMSMEYYNIYRFTARMLTRNLHVALQYARIPMSA